MDDTAQPHQSATDAPQDADASDRPPSAGPTILTSGLTAPGDLQQHLSRLAAQFAPKGGEVRVRFVSDPEMADAHERFKDVPGTTDVLTFDLADTINDPFDVDLLVCIDEAQRQASDRGIPIEHELLLYITHGILHCTGFDDDTEPHAKAMHTREDELLSAIGVGPVFARASSGETQP